MLKFNANDRIYGNISHFQSVLCFRKNKKNTTDLEKHLFTNFGKNHDYVFFELYNIDYAVGKEAETFYWYDVNSEIAKAPCCFHDLSLHTLESYVEYISSLNPNDFKLSRKPWENYGFLRDKKSSHVLKVVTNKISRNSNSENIKINSASTPNLPNSKVYLENDIMFDMRQKIINY